jgi:hypothetical protein
MTTHTPDLSLPSLTIFEVPDVQLPPANYAPTHQFSLPIPDSIMQVAMGRHRGGDAQGLADLWNQSNGGRQNDGDRGQEAVNSLDNAERTKQILDQVTGPVRLDFLSIRGLFNVRFA